MTASSAAVAAGLFDLALAAFHMLFWRLFGWPERLAGLDSANRGVLPVLNLALIAMFIVTGLALLTASGEAATTAIGRVLLVGLALFWLARAIVQGPYFGFRHKASVLIVVVCLVGAGLHALPLILRQGS